jgi:hypothetical protein
MEDDGTNEVQLDAGDAYVTPLRAVATEAHEIYLELKAAGFPESMMGQILGHMLSDAILYREEYTVVEVDDDDEDDDDEDDLEDGPV